MYLTESRLKILSLAWPVIIEMLLQMTVGIVDVAMVGHLGAVALAGVGLGHQITFFSLNLFGALTTGATAIIARHIGANEHEAASSTARQILLLAAIIAVTFALLLHFSSAQAVNLMTLLNKHKDSELNHIAVQYLKLVSLTLPFSYIMAIINGMLRGIGDMKTPMKLIMTVNIINIILNYVLIFGIEPFFLGIGALGSATATTIAWLIGGILALYVIFSGKTALDFTYNRKFLPQVTTLNKVATISIPALGEQLLMRGGQMIFAAFVAGLGTASYAAHQVALSAESISFMPGFAFAVAATTLVGQALGSHDHKLAELQAREAKNIALLFMSGMGLVLFSFSTQIVGLYTKDPQVINLSANCLKLIALGQPFLAHVMVLAGALRGAGDTKWTMLVTALGMWPVRLTSAYLLAYMLNLGLLGAWGAMNIDLLIRSLLFVLRFKNGQWKNIRI